MTAALGDVAYLTVVQVELVLLIAHLYGRPLDDHEARRLDVLLALGVEAGAVRLRRGRQRRASGASRSRPTSSRGLQDELAARVNRTWPARSSSRLAGAVRTW